MPNLLRLSLAHGVDALRHASEQLDLAVADRAVQALLDCSGRRYFTGIGKSGHSAARMASSLSSIGLAAHWVHGTEWSHGELGAQRDRLNMAFSQKIGEFAFATPL